MSETPGKETLPIEPIEVSGQTEQAEESKPFVDPFKLNQAAQHREMLAILGTVSATLRGMSVRESKRAKEAKEREARCRRKAIQRMILTWAAAAGICIGFFIAKAQGLVDSRILWTTNTAIISMAMYVSGYLHAWGWAKG